MFCVLVDRLMVLVDRLFVLVHGLFVLVDRLLVLVERLFVIVNRIRVAHNRGICLGGVPREQKMLKGAEDALETPTQSHVSPSILVYKEKPRSGVRACTGRSLS